MILKRKTGAALGGCRARFLYDRARRDGGAVIKRFYFLMNFL